MALVMALGFIGRGADSNVATPNGAAGDAQPTPGATFQTTGTFDDIPLPRGATEIGTKTEQDGAMVEPVQSRGVTSLFGAWEGDGRRLEVSAGPAPRIADDTQFNLVLLASLEPDSQLNTAP